MVYVNFAIIDLLTYFEKHLNPLQPDKILLIFMCKKMKFVNFAFSCHIVTYYSRVEILVERLTIA